MAFVIAQEVPLLAGCSEDDLRCGLARFHHRRLQPGEVLIEEGSEDLEFFLISSGTLAISRGGEFVRMLSGPTFLGEEAMLGLGARSATVTALTPVEALATGQLGFDEMMRLPGVGRQIATAVADRIRGRDATTEVAS
jgi:CRP-like cAMP-binding protein